MKNTKLYIITKHIENRKNDILEADSSLATCTQYCLSILQFLLRNDIDSDVHRCSKDMQKGYYKLLYQ